MVMEEGSDKEVVASTTGFITGCECFNSTSLSKVHFAFEVLAPNLVLYRRVKRAMSEADLGRPKSWNMYTVVGPSPSQTTDGPWKNLGTSLSAISFGFVATAILIFMFLIMAIFEHLLRPRLSFLSSENGNNAGSLELGTRQNGMHAIEKLRTSQTTTKPYSSSISVLMPGQHCPTYIAQPAPLPCPREGMHWPSYSHSFVYP